MEKEKDRSVARSSRQGPNAPAADRASPGRARPRADTSERTSRISAESPEKAGPAAAVGKRDPKTGFDTANERGADEETRSESTLGHDKAAPRPEKTSAGEEVLRDEITAVLEKYIPPGAARKLVETYPARRILWAAQVAAEASGKRRIARPASYLLRVLADDGQWERHLCDCYARERSEREREKERAARALARRKAIREARAASEREKKFEEYLASVPPGEKERIKEEVLQAWARGNGVDLDSWRERGCLVRRTTEALYFDHMKEKWLSLDMPGTYGAPPPGDGGADPDGRAKCVRRRGPGRRRSDVSETVQQVS